MALPDASGCQVSERSKLFFFALEALAQTFSSVRNSRLKYEPRPGLLFVGVNVVLYTATRQKIEWKRTLSIVNLELI